MRRLWSLGFALLVACSGGPGGITLPPSTFGAGFAEMAARHRAHRIPVSMQITIPRHRRRDANQLHRNTISPLTLSVSVVDNGAKPQIFNTTPASKNCSTASGSLVCAFQILVQGGKNTLVVKTYSAKDAGGYVLDQATAVAHVTAATRSVGIILGPVISNTNDSGAGSLRQALTDANAGDTLMYVGTTPATITLSGGAVALHKNVTIDGPGAGKLTISANNATQAFVVATGVTATISGVTITKGTSATKGGAIGNAGTLTLTNDTISNSTATTAGGAVENTGVMTSTSNTYSGNTALDGGAIDNTGTLTATSDTFSANNAVGTGVGPTIVNATRPARMPKQPRLKRPHTRRGVWQRPPAPKQVFPPDHMRPAPVSGNVPNGGAIYNGIAGTIDISQSSFTGNGAQQGDGGAISDAASAAAWTIANDTFANNTAAYGGAVAVDTAGTLDTDTFTTNSGYSGNGSSVAPYAFGGAVYASALLTVKNCTFNGNIAGGGTQAAAYGYGGAIEADNAALTVSGSTFKNNVAGGANSSGSSGQGGAIDTTSTSAFAVSITNSTFTSNIAGGGSTGTSYGYGGAVDLENNNTLVTSGSTFTSNTAGGDGYGDGGAIYGKADVNDTNGTYAKNAATGTTTTNVFGGAIDSNSTVELSGSSFSQNTATAGANATTVGGGAVFANATMTVANSTFTSNSVSAAGSSGVEGGAIQDASPITITNSTFTSNSATTGSGAEYCCYADGGAVDDQNSAVTISGSTFTSNSVNGGAGSQIYGGAAECDAGGTTLTNVTFSQNSATASGGTFALANGGALYIVGATTIANGTFNQNSATTPGSAQGWGGAVNGGNVTFSGSLTNNTASNQGAGIWMGSGSITNSTISGNTVTTAVAAALPTPDGGAGVNEQGNGVTITGSTISGNTVAGAGAGGGVLNDGGAPSFTNDTIANNTSSVDGGGIEDIGGTATGSVLLHVTLYGNTATSGNGGNWNNQATPTTPGSITNSIVAGGSAGTSGVDIYNNGGINSGDYNLIQAAVFGTALTGTTTHNVTGVSPLLNPLGSYGGPTQTMQETLSSPSYNIIPVVSASCNATGVTTDQRGHTRPGTGHANCDMGAYELP